MRGNLWYTYYTGGKMEKLLEHIQQAIKDLEGEYHRTKTDNKETLIYIRGSLNTLSVISEYIKKELY